MTQHTPGPWIYEPHDGFGTSYKSAGRRRVKFPLGFISKRHGSPLAELEPSAKADGFDLVPSFVKLPVDELDANAQLMAAAPELMEVVRDIVSDCRGCINPGLYDLAVAALAKAEGK